MFENSFAWISNLHIFNQNEQTLIFSSLYFAIYCKYFKISKSKSQSLKYQNFTSSALSYDWIRKLDFEAIFRYFEKRCDRLVNDIKKQLLTTVTATIIDRIIVIKLLSYPPIMKGVTSTVFMQTIYQMLATA